MRNDDYLHVPWWTRARAKLAWWTDSLGMPPVPVLLATLIGWTLIVYTQVLAGIRWCGWFGW